MAKILLVDDDDVLLRMYTKKFVDEGFEVETASDGEEGLAKMKVQKPDVIILDFLLPKLDGYTMLQRIKSDPMLKDIPVIFLTNVYVDRADILQKGAAVCLVKIESRPDDVVKHVRRFLPVT